MRALLQLLLLFCLWAGPAHAQAPWQHSLKSFTDFRRMSGPPLVTKYARTSAVKVLLDIRRNKLYYINYQFAKLHFEFAYRYLGENPDLGAFNDANYSASADRRYVLGNLDYFPFLDKYALEFSVGDDLPPELIPRIFAAVQTTFFAPDKLCLFVNTPLLQEKSATLRPALPLLLPDEVYNGQTIQSVSAGKACGVLRRVSADSLSAGTGNNGDILLIDGFNDDLPLCAGAIVTRLQTPLSHISVLAHNRGTPVVAVRGDAIGPVLLAVGRPVCLDVRADTFYLLPDAGKHPARQPRVRLPAIDLRVTALAGVRELTAGRRNAYGAKACSLGEIARTPGAGRKFDYPKGAFAIPFSAAHRHFHRWGIDSLVAATAADTSLAMDPEQLRAALKKIRDAIRRAPVDSILMKEIATRMEAGGIAARARFRSSANAEDIAGFNAAGLYDSKTGSLTDTAHPVADALRSVWASLYREKAWLERGAAGIPQTAAHMAVLVHEGFPGEAANGVAITRNLYRSGNGGFVVNVQLGETPVVSPPAGVRAEQFITYYDVPGDFYATKKPVDQIAYSSLSEGTPILSMDEIRQLTEALTLLKARFYYHTGWKSAGAYEDAALDVEFKFVDGPKGRRLLIKQARPYR